jgi:hypothetical protein
MHPNDLAPEIFGEQVLWPGMGADGKFANGSFEYPADFAEAPSQPAACGL